MARRAVLVLVLLAAAGAAAQAQVISCPFNGSGGDQVTRGFYISTFPLSTLGTVTLNYFPGGAGAYTVIMTARSGSFAGPVIGTATQSFVLAASPQQVTFDFGNVAVTPFTTITFEQNLTVSPGGVLFYDTGNCGLGVPCQACPLVTETEDTTPPLSTFRRGSIGVVVSGTAASIPVASPRALGLMVAALALAGTFLLLRRG